MRVFVAGATGVIGRRLVPKLVAQGYEVTGMSRTESKIAELWKMGSRPVIADALDREALRSAVISARPEVVIHQLTAIPKVLDPSRLGEALEATNRLRREGTRHLVDAAGEAGARRIVAQSVAFAYAPRGGTVKEENDSLYLDAPPEWRAIVDAVDSLERTVLEAKGIEGLVLRYGQFYGPGTAYAPDGSVAELVKKRRFPVVGAGRGVFSFIHVDDAADATALAVSRGAPGIYNIVDNEPAPVREWLPIYAKALGAKPPRRVPGFLARWLAGDYVALTMTQGRGASNAKARRELGWAPKEASWREGFRREASQPLVR